MNKFKEKFGFFPKKTVTFDGESLTINKHTIPVSEIEKAYFKPFNFVKNQWGEVRFLKEGQEYDPNDVFAKNYFSFTKGQTEKAVNLLDALAVEVVHDESLELESTLPQNQEEITYSENTTKIGMSTIIDHNKEFIHFLRDDRIIPFAEIIDYEIAENGETKVASGAKAAAIGTVLFGPAGMIAGAVIGRGKEKEFADSLYINIKLKDTTPIRIDMLTNKVKKSSKDYQLSYSILEQIAEQLQPIVEKNQSENLIQAPTNNIREFKTLLDEGIITQEEFDQKKKELLGL